MFNLKPNKTIRKKRPKQQTKISQTDQPFLLNVTNGNIDSDDSLEYVENLLRQSNDRIIQSNTGKKKRKSSTKKNGKNVRINTMKISVNKSKPQPLNGNTKKNKKKWKNKKIQKNGLNDKKISFKLQSNNENGTKIRRKKLKTRIK